MNNDDYTYFKADALDYGGQLKNIKKSTSKLQPLFEAITNAIEAIKLSPNKDHGSIEIELNFIPNLTDDLDSIRITIIDNGIGFNDTNFTRFKRLFDRSKNFFNHGSGRIQYLHFFNMTEIQSIYQDNESSTGYLQRFLKLSKSKPFLEQNSIMSYSEPQTIDVQSTQTKVTFKQLLTKDDESFYKKLTSIEFKRKLLQHYLAYFSEKRNDLPQIKIKSFRNSKLIEEEEITQDDIQKEDKVDSIEIEYKRFSTNKKTLLKTDRKETFQIKAFKLSSNSLDRNCLKLTSKGEIVEGKIAKKFELSILKDEDIIDDMRYLFLISGEYINIRDGDNRGNLKIYTTDEFKEDDSLFRDDEVILLDDIEAEVNNKILSMYNEILENYNKHRLNLDKLQEMFLLDSKTLAKVKNSIKVHDSDATILKKVYKEDATLIAEKDAKIKEQIDSLIELNTASKDYSNDLNKRVTSLTKSIPLQNRTALTHYVARRKIVLDLFQKILDSELTIQKETKRNMDEKLLHNLIFQQTSDSPNKSDLWLISEDFIYFKGTSEAQLSDIKIDGTKILKEDNELDDDEIDYIKSLNENRYAKRPDVLLFPNEGKCIIIEFKNTKVNTAKHLTQIDNYASLIWNFTKKEFQFNTFYGYLIGENIEPREVRMHDARFEHSYHFDYLFRPSKPIAGIFRDGDANLYTEVITYSTLLKRAKKRNEVFIEKLLDNPKK